jgi:predicted AlkP superfamily phosphohydrolase/phosphomutase
MSSNKKKVVVIGLDGATFDLLDPLMNLGKMPNLDRLVKNGSSGRLLSTVPPVTGPAWVSFMTGKNPGKHGIFAFQKRVPRSYTWRAIHAGSIHSETLWSILSAAQRKVVVANVPVTYPPSAVNGFLVSGFLTPDDNCDSTYPASLAEELKSLVGDIKYDVDWRNFASHESAALIQDSQRITLNTARMTLHLMERCDYDFLITVFNGPDRLQHSFWKLLEPLVRQEPEALSPLQESLINCFTKLDIHLGEICQMAGNDATLFIISDHGFHRLEGFFYINHWLQQQGWMQFHGRPLVDRILGILRQADIFTMRKYLRRRFFPRVAANSFDIGKLIDWSTTVAYCPPTIEQGIYLNVAGRDPAGVVQPGAEYEALREQIMAELKKLKVPTSNRSLVTAVHKREEIYKGDYVDDAPDIVFSMQDYGCAALPGFSNKLYRSTHEEKTYGTGAHHMQGIFIGAGPDIKSVQHLTNLNITDLAPTILYSIGLSIPEDMDGRVLQEIFDDSFIASHPVQLAPLSSQEAQSQSSPRQLSEAEDLKVKERLRALGYLD